MGNELKGKPGTLIPIKCDLTKDDQVLSMFAQIKRDLGGVDVCVNNAGFAIPNDLLKGSPKEWREMLDLNVVALCLCTREAVASMRERGVDDGHIFHINSLGGHCVPNNASFSFYCGTKHMVTMLTEALRRELKNSNIRITSISPGVVETEFAINAGFSEEMSKQFYSNMPSIQSDDVTDMLIHVLSAPPHVQVHELIVIPTKAD
ncbi:dehydrogenase/reductase SDR family member 11-like isoform X2 [Eriocheir sinensis]|nr:dehydrogenase/reductase SDR family member 11-like isoform X2 [Eriocheir sinensis]